MAMARARTTAKARVRVRAHLLELVARQLRLGLAAQLLDVVHRVVGRVVHERGQPLVHGLGAAARGRLHAPLDLRLPRGARRRTRGERVGDARVCCALCWRACAVRVSPEAQEATRCLSAEHAPARSTAWRASSRWRLRVRRSHGRGAPRPGSRSGRTRACRKWCSSSCSRQGAHV